MKILTPGHEYLLSNIKTDNRDENTNILKFYKEKGVDKDDMVGTSNQEVLRALIDRVNYLDNELPHSFNKEIIFHLRKALALHEARHLIRMVDKDVAVENFPVGDDGHFICLDKEKEYFYQEEINDDPFLAHFRKDMRRKPNTKTGIVDSSYSTQDEQAHLHIGDVIDNTIETIEKIKEVEGYREKKLFLDPEEDRLVMDNKDIPTITEVAYDKNKTYETIENSTVIKVLAKNEDQIYSPEKCSSIDFYSGNAEDLLVPEAILDTIVINTNKASFSVNKDTLLTMFSSVYKNNKDIGKIVYSDNLYTTSMVGLEKDIAIFMFRDHHPVKQKEIKYIKELENEKVILTTLTTTELSLIGNKEFFIPIDVVIVVAEVTYKDRNSFVLSVSKDGYGINNLVTINIDNFVYKSLDDILVDNSIEKVYLDKEGTTMQLEFAKAMAFEVPKKITNIGIGGYFRVNTINIIIDDTFIDLVFLDQLGKSKRVSINCTDGDSTLFYTIHDFIKSLNFVDGVNSEHKSYRFLGGDIVIDSYDALIERVKLLIAEQNDKLLLEAMLDNFAAKIFQIHNDCLAGDIKPIVERIVFNITFHTKVEDVENIVKEPISLDNNKEVIAQDISFLNVDRRNMLLQKLLAIPFVSNNNILDVTNVIFDHFVYIPNSLLIKKLFKGNLVNVQQIKVELVKQELNGNAKDLINSSINYNKHCDSAILVEYNVNTNTVIDKTTGKPIYKKEKVNSTYFFIFYIKYNNNKG